MIIPVGPTAQDWQAAHDDPQTGFGDWLQAPEGETFWDAPVNITKTINIKGHGRNGSIIRMVNDQACLRLNIGGQRTYGQQFEGFTLGTVGDRTSGALMEVGAIGGASFDVRVTNAGGGRPYRGIVVRQATQSRMQLTIEGCSNAGLAFMLAQPGDHIIDFYLLDGSKINGNLGSGVYIENLHPGDANLVEGIHINAHSIYGNGRHGIEMYAAPNCEIKTVHVRGAQIDSNGLCGVMAGGSGRIHSCTFDDAWTSYNGQHGYYFGPNCEDMSVKAGDCLLNGLSGIYNNGAKRTLLDVNTYSNGRIQSAFGTVVVSTSRYVKVLGLHDNSGLYAHRQNGVRIMQGAEDTVFDPQLITNCPIAYDDKGTRTVRLGR
jgi:hypothetical protein